MAAAAVAVETLTVALQGREERLTVLSFVDRRTRPNRRKQWLLIRSLERLLFGVGEGDRSTGAFAAHLGKCSMADAPLCCEKARVADTTITQQELDAGQQTSPPFRLASVTASPLRRVNQSIYLLTTGAREASFRNIKTIAECLADEVMNAAKARRASSCPGDALVGRPLQGFEGEGRRWCSWELSCWSCC